MNVAGKAFESLEIDGDNHTSDLEIKSPSNTSILNMTSGDLFPMACTDSKWLPQATNGARPILSWAGEGTDGNQLSPNNVIQIENEVYDLQLLQKADQRFYIKRPENPFFHLGLNNSQERDDGSNDGDLLGGEGSVVTFKDGVDTCRVQFKIGLSLSDLIEMISNQKTKHSSVNYSEFLSLMEVDEPSPHQLGLKRNRHFTSQEYRRMQDFKDSNLAEVVTLLARASLLESRDSSNFYLSNCQLNVSGNEAYCQFKAKELE